MPSSFTSEMILGEFVDAAQMAPEGSLAWTMDVVAAQLRERNRRAVAAWRDRPGNREKTREYMRAYRARPAVRNRDVVLDPKRPGPAARSYDARENFRGMRHGPSCACGTCKRAWSGWAHRIRPIVVKPS